MAGAYFVRTRGRITGPFDVVSLQRMAKRGQLSRVHEVSEDRQSWSAAGDFEDLYPQAPSAYSHVEQAPQPAAPQDGSYAVASEVPPGASVAGSVPRAGSAFYYSQGGSAVGPLPLTVLRTLAQNGTLRAGDLVWQEGAEVASPAWQLTHLAGLFSAQLSAPSSEQLGYSRQQTPLRLTAKQATAQLRRAGDRGASVGVGTGAISLLMLNLPIAVVNGSAIWWWTALSAEGVGWFATFCFFFLFSGMALCAVGPLTRGAARGVVYVVIGALLFVLLSMLGLSSPQPGQSFIASLAVFGVPATAALLAGTCGARAAMGGAAGGVRASAVVFGAILVVAALTVLVTMLSGIGDVKDLPGWAVATFALTVISLLAATVGGFMALGGARPSFGRGLNTAVGTLAVSSIALLVIAALVATGGMTSAASSASRSFMPLPRHGFESGDGETGVLIFFTVMRALVLFWGPLLVLGAGIFELLVTAPLASLAAGVFAGGPKANAATGGEAIANVY